MAAKYLLYNTAKMETVKKTYKDCVKEMDDLQTKMQTMVDDIKEGWQSKAGDAFFTKYDDEWLKGFKQYREVLDHMADNLGRRRVR